MTAKTTEELSAETVSRVTRNLGLVRRFARQIVENPGVLDQLPSGALVLVPDNDPELAELNIQAGLRSLREGHDVTFHHLRSSEIPPPVDIPGAVFSPVPSNPDQP